MSRTVTPATTEGQWIPLGRKARRTAGTANTTETMNVHFQRRMVAELSRSVWPRDLATE